MDDTEKTELFEMDMDMDSEKMSRRSSILKPQKPRKPLSTLDFSESNPDNTLARATRRVSFASSNFVKPFATDPEVNTVWDNTYEEEVDHMDSTKSSCDQTQATKTSNLLNMSSIYSTPFGEISDENSFSEYCKPTEFINIDAKHVKIVANTEESLISITRKLENKSIAEFCSRSETVDFAITNSRTSCKEEYSTSSVISKETIKSQENVSLAPVSSKTKDIICSTTKLIDITMEVTKCVTDKENVHPLINDLTLITSKQNCTTANKTKYYDDDLEITKPLEGRAPISFKQCGKNLDCTSLDVTMEGDDKSESPMELTCSASDNDVIFSSKHLEKENKLEEFNEIVCQKPAIENKTLDAVMKTVYFDDSVNLMQFTCADQNDDSVQYKMESTSNKSKRKTIHFKETEGNMDFTVTDSNIVLATKENMHTKDLLARSMFLEQPITDNAEKEWDVRNKTIILNQFENDMEFTNTFPVKIQANAFQNTQHYQIHDTPEMLKNEKTIHFTDSGEEMEFTNAFSIPTNIIKQKTTDTDLKNTIFYDNSQCNMEFTTTLTRKKMDYNASNFAEPDDIEFTGVISTQPIIEKKIEAVKNNDTRFECDMECEMSLTENIQTRLNPSNIPKTPSINISDYKISSLVGPDPIRHDLCERDASLMSLNLKSNLPIIKLNSTSLLKDSEENKPVVSKSTSSIKENIQDNYCSSDKVDHKENNISTLNSSKPINNIKRSHGIYTPDKTIKKVKIQESVPKNPKSILINRVYPQSTEQSEIQVKEKSIRTDKINDTLNIKVSPVLEVTNNKTNLQTSVLANSNILYSEPMKVKLKTSNFVPIPDMSNSLNLQCLDGSLNLHHISTPASSFHISLPTMSPCTETEDTQQLIHATFSKPDTLDILDSNKEKEYFNVSNKQNVLKLEDSKNPLEESSKFLQRQGGPETSCRLQSEEDISGNVKMNEKTFIKENITSSMVENKSNTSKFEEKLKKSLKRRTMYFQRQNSVETSNLCVLDGTASESQVKINEKTFTKEYNNPKVENCEILKVTDNDKDKETFIVSRNASKSEENPDHILEESTNFLQKQVEGTYTCSMVPKNQKKADDKTFTKEDTKPVLINVEIAHSSLQPEMLSDQQEWEFIKRSEDVSITNEKSCFLEDTTPLALVTEEFDQSDEEPKSPAVNSPIPIINPSNFETKLPVAKVNNDSAFNIEPVAEDIKTTHHNNSLTSNSSADLANYTMRAQLVLNDIEKNLIHYEPEDHQNNSDIVSMSEKFKENCRIIKELLNQPKKQRFSLEEKHRQDVEESLNSANGAVISSEEDSGALAVLGFIAPRTLEERVCEVSKRTKKCYWEYVKMEDDYYYFYTLFGTMPFKVHVHPELGIVYSVETFSNISDISAPLCHYQLNIFQDKLKWHNLLPVLGTKFDIFTLLDYIYMSMEEIISFHIEFTNLKKTYGYSHRFRMNSDYSVVFEILNVELIIYWIITIKMPLAGLTSITKDDVTAVHNIGQKVNEEHIKVIVHNTPKGPNFLRNFIENVDEFVNRIGRRLPK